MLNERERKPVWRVKCLRDVKEEVPHWDGDWYYHLPEYKYIEWLEINPIHRESKSILLEDKVTDNTNYLISLLKDNNIPFSIENECLRYGVTNVQGMQSNSYNDAYQFAPFSFAVLTTNGQVICYVREGEKVL